MTVLRLRDCEACADLGIPCADHQRCGCGRQLETRSFVGAIFQTCPSCHTTRRIL